MQTYMTSAEYVKLSKQVTYIENGENMILFHEEFVPTACIVTANARIQWISANTFSLYALCTKMPHQHFCASLLSSPG